MFAALFVFLPFVVISSMTITTAFLLVVLLSSTATAMFVPSRRMLLLIAVRATLSFVTDFFRVTASTVVAVTGADRILPVGCNISIPPAVVVVIMGSFGSLLAAVLLRMIMMATFVSVPFGITVALSLRIFLLLVATVRFSR